jgi:CheY-like chemotaxis protein
VVNARDAMPKGGKITIETGNASLDDAYARVHGEVAAGQYVMLAVTDTGAGMRPEIAERAFEPFFTTKPEGQGTGLGLSQVFGFVKQSRGHVKLDSEPGVGTTVKVYLPRTMEAATPIAIASAPPEPTPAGSEVILVVEDDEDVLISVVEQLRYLGYKTITATTAHEALSILQSDHKIDLLFTDVVLPGTMKGGQLASRAVDIRPGLPVLFTSGFTQNSIVHGGVIDPGAALISKPYKLDVLAVRIREILQRGPELAVEDKA